MFPCASYHAGTKRHVLSSDVMCEYIYLVLANFSCVCVDAFFFGGGVAGRVWTLRLDFCEKRSWRRLFGPGSHLQGPSFPRGITPIWCPMSMIVLPWDTFDLNSSHILVTISDILLSFVPVQWKDHSVLPNSSSCILQQSIGEASTTHLFFPDLFTTACKMLPVGS